jgi:hypothetical protein
VDGECGELMVDADRVSDLVVGFCHGGKRSIGIGLRKAVKERRAGGLHSCKYVLVRVAL